MGAFSAGERAVREKLATTLEPSSESRILESVD